MTIREFVDKYNIHIAEFCRSCEINRKTFDTYLFRCRTPNLRNAIKIVLQSGGLITLEDLLRRDQPLMRLDKPDVPWTPAKKLKTRNKAAIKANVDKIIKRKKHYRTLYYKIIDEL